MKLANPSSSRLTSLPSPRLGWGRSNSKPHSRTNVFKVAFPTSASPGGSLELGWLKLTCGDSDWVGPRAREFAHLACSPVDAASGLRDYTYRTAILGLPLRFLISRLSLATTGGRTCHSRKFSLLSGGFITQAQIIILPPAVLCVELDLDGTLA